MVSKVAGKARSGTRIIVNVRAQESQGGLLCDFGEVVSAVDPPREQIAGTGDRLNIKGKGNRRDWTLPLPRGKPEKI